ncbi:MAG: hypothetical protein V5A68_06250 [Candidatus Thermoplasmatota archaeon]
MTTPESKDPISKSIIIVFLNKRNQNISQITENVMDKRDSASRRVIRDRLKELERKK